MPTIFFANRQLLLEGIKGDERQKNKSEWVAKKKTYLEKNNFKC
jgi:hypothetical protein